MSYSESAPSTVVFTLVYLIISLCFVFRTTEFVSFGLTIESIFKNILENESDSFIQFNIRKTSLTLLVHSFLPLGYLVGLSATSGFDWLPPSHIWWTTFVIFSLLFPLITVVAVFYWSRNNWSNHPIAQTLRLFCDNNHSWQSLAADINSEYHRVEKIVLHVSNINRVIATDNWIFKSSPYGLCIAHQSDSVLILCSADTHNISTEGAGTIQYVNIEVKTTRPNVASFFIRCKAQDFQDLQDKVQRPITILEGIKFHKSTLDKFLEVFREAVRQNPPYVPPHQLTLEQCIGCMVVTSNVKLVKRCGEDTECVNCYCRPQWCIDCMGRWFASRQEQDRPQTWLGSSCTCPLCRSTFCLLDVCPLAQPDLPT